MYVAEPDRPDDDFERDDSPKFWVGLPTMSEMSGIKNDNSPQPNGGGYWSYRLTISFENTHTVRSTVTKREAREGILRDIAGEWNERSPLVFII